MSAVCAAASSAEDGSSSSQIGRGMATSRASDKPPLLPGRKIGGWQRGDRIETDRAERGARIAAAKLAAEPCAPEVEILEHRERGFERVLVAEIMRLLADAAVRYRRPRASGRRLRSAAAPRSCAAARICPRRCGRSPPAPRRRRAKSRDRKKPRARRAGRPGPRPQASANQLMARKSRTRRVIANVRHAGRLSLSFVHMERLKKRSYNPDRYTAFAPKSPARTLCPGKCLPFNILAAEKPQAGPVVKEQHP